MNGTIRAIGFSLCTLVASAISRDSVAFFGEEFGPFCGDRVDDHYIVQKGDNLWNIAKKVYGSTVEFSYQTGKLISLPLVIARANRLQGYKLHEGDKLLIPRGGIESSNLCPADIKAVRVSEYEDVRKYGEL